MRMPLGLAVTVALTTPLPAQAPRAASVPAPVLIKAGRLIDGRSDAAQSNVGIVVEGERIKADRKSTRLNSSHSQISYAGFCLKKKKDTPKATGRFSTPRYSSCPQTSRATSSSGYTKHASLSPSLCFAHLFHWRHMPVSFALPQ